MHSSSIACKSLFEHLSSGVGHFSELKKKKIVYYESEMQSSNPEHLINCPLYHQTCNLGTWIFNFHFSLFFFFHLSLKVTFLI